MIFCLILFWTSASFNIERELDQELTDVALNEMIKPKIKQIKLLVNTINKADQVQTRLKSSLLVDKSVLCLYRYRLSDMFLHSTEQSHELMRVGQMTWCEPA